MKFNINSQCVLISYGFIVKSCISPRDQVPSPVYLLFCMYKIGTFKDAIHLWLQDAGVWHGFWSISIDVTCDSCCCSFSHNCIESSQCYCNIHVINSFSLSKFEIVINTVSPSFEDIIPLAINFGILSINSLSDSCFQISLQLSKDLSFSEGCCGCDNRCNNWGNNRSNGSYWNCGICCCCCSSCILSRLYSGCGSVVIICDWSIIISFTIRISDTNNFFRVDLNGVVSYIFGIPCWSEFDCVSSSIKRIEVKETITKLIRYWCWLDCCGSWHESKFSVCVWSFATRCIHSVVIEISTNKQFLWCLKSETEGSSCTRSIPNNFIVVMGPIVVLVINLEIVEGLDEVTWFNEESTIIFIVNKWNLSFISICPDRISIRPRSTVCINVPWISDSNEILNNISTCVLDNMGTHDFVGMTSCYTIYRWSTSVASNIKTSSQGCSNFWESLIPSVRWTIEHVCGSTC